MFVEGDLSYAGISVVTVLSAGIGAYIGAYLKKKGENLATHEDFQRVLTEVKETTRATKEIENKISDTVWDRQKRWELTREIFLELLRAVASADVALTHAGSNLLAALGSRSTHEVAKVAGQGVDECIECSRTLGNMRGILAIVAGYAVIGSFSKVCDSYVKAVQRLNWNEYDSEDLRVRFDEFRTAATQLQYAVRTELGIPIPTSQSTESSATPSPGPPAPE